MEVKKYELELFKAIRQAIANISLEDDSLLDSKELEQIQIDKVYKKVIKENRYGKV